jgi:septin family protein
MVVGMLVFKYKNKNHVRSPPNILLILGESGLGKSTLVNTLFNAQLYPPKETVELTHEATQTVEVQSITSDIEENGVKLRLTVVDTPGFGDFVNNEERYLFIYQFVCVKVEIFNIHL